MVRHKLMLSLLLLSSSMLAMETGKAEVGDDEGVGADLGALEAGREVQDNFEELAKKCLRYGLVRKVEQVEQDNFDQRKVVQKALERLYKKDKQKFLNVQQALLNASGKTRGSHSAKVTLEKDIHHAVRAYYVREELEWYKKSYAAKCDDIESAKRALGAEALEKQKLREKIEKEFPGLRQKLADTEARNAELEKQLAEKNKKRFLCC